jgi:quercetin dioxygenase-like cupin family protein
MPVKTNNATINRPDGKRLLDAPAVLVNIEEHIKQLKDESAWGKSDRNAITVFKTPGLTMVLSIFHKGAEIKDLQMDGLLILQVIEGKISVQTNREENLSVKKNQLLALHHNDEQTLITEEETIILLSAIKQTEEGKGI